MRRVCATEQKRARDVRASGGGSRRDTTNRSVDGERGEAEIDLPLAFLWRAMNSWGIVERKMRWFMRWRFMVTYECRALTKMRTGS